MYIVVLLLSLLYNTGSPDVGTVTGFSDHSRFTGTIVAENDSTSDPMKVKGVVYLARCTVNGKLYVGKTVQTLDGRKKGHFHDAKVKRNNSAFENAIRTHGKNAFEWSILFHSNTDAQLRAKEVEFIKTLNTKKPNGYNLTDGGDGHAGLTPSAETLVKRSAALKGRIFSDEHRAAISVANKGRVMSEEWRANIGAAQKGHKQSAETIEKRRLKMTGRKMSLEACANMSAARKGKKLSPETCAAISKGKKGKPSNRKGVKLGPETLAKMSAAMLGKKHTTETRAKMSAANKGKQLSEEHRRKIGESNRLVTQRQKVAQLKTQLSLPLNKGDAA